MFFKRDLVLGQEYLAFLILNLFDLFLTGWFFRNHAIEANGIARWVLKLSRDPHVGLRLFALYKFLLVIFVIVVCEVIAMASVKRARFVILLGCAVYLMLIFYEAYLLATQAPVVEPQPSVIVAHYWPARTSPIAVRWEYRATAPAPTRRHFRVVRA